MGLTLVTAPASEPVTLNEVKDHLRIAHGVTDQDSYLTGLITAARMQAELFTRRQFITATYRKVMDRFPRGYYEVQNRAAVVTQMETLSQEDKAIYLPRPPLISVTSIQYQDTDLNWQTLDSSNYIVVTDWTPGKLYPTISPGGGYWPATTIQPAAVKIEYTCGYGSSGSYVPEMVKLAIKEIIRAIFDGADLAKAMEGVKLLLTPYRIFDDRAFQHA